MRSHGTAARPARVLACAAAWLGAARADAAELRMQAPEACVEAASVGEQVEGLLGRPLASVEGVDFAVSIAPSADRRQWTLRLETQDKVQGDRRTRDLSARTCAELADAAAVAITMSIKSADSMRAERRARPQLPAPAPHVDGPAVATRAPSPAAPSMVVAPPARPAVALSALVDGGAMPRAALGLGLEASLQLRRLRLVGLGAFFPSQQATVTGGAGGTFQLAAAGALACVTQGLGRFTLLGCAGGEAGRLTGEGVGVSAPRPRGALWMAARAEVGGTWVLATNVALIARAGAALPFFRPKFLLDNTTAVHQPGSLSARVTLGLELAF